MLPSIYFIVPVIIITNLWIRDAKIVQESSSDTSTSDIIEKYEHITKSPNDQRSYRGLILKNQMKVFLISDQLAYKSAASMTVGVGALNDFRGVPGIANLVGYLVMVGSKKYPSVYHFENLVSSRGGESKVFTRTDDTNFSFCVNSVHFADSLERFSHFFIEPLVSYVRSEPILENCVCILHLDFLNLSEMDTYRIEEVEKSICKKNHPYNHLFCGNKETLYEHAKGIPQSSRKVCPNPRNMSLNDQVQQFHSLWYSSNIMSLAVLGRESLDKLENMVVSFFKDVPDTNAKQYVYPYKHHAWGPNQLKHKIYIIPLADEVQLLRLNFPIPDLHNQYKTSVMY